MRTAIIGNSHVLAVHAALAERGQPADGFDHYFIPGGWEIELAQNADGSLACLLKNTPPLDEADVGIDLNRYDRFLICAMGWWAARNVVIEGQPTHPLGYLACVDWGSAIELPLPTVKAVSHQVMQVTLEYWIREHPVVRLAKFVSEHFPQRPVLAQPWPAPDRCLKSDADWFVNRWYGANGAYAWHSYFLAQHRAVLNIVAELGANVRLLDYPLPGPGSDGFMDAHWCDPDPFHANHRYGELILRQMDQS